jgi:methyltransferase (TIGR00027 family)
MQSMTRPAPATSASAERVAALRFLGTFEPNPRLRNPDRLAADFIKPLPRIAIGSACLRPCVRGFVNYRFPGAIAYHVARTKHFDRIARDATAAGVTQLVILGAGYDTRALRLHDCLRTATIYEVDRPATLARKRSIVRRSARASLPGNVRYVSVDLETDDLGVSLTAAGFAKELPALFLWEGVTMFIAAAAVGRTLLFIATATSATSTVAFDYVAQAAVLRPAAFRGGAEAARHFSRSGEPWRFGLDPELAVEFLGSHRLSVVSHYRAKDIEGTYLAGEDGTPLAAVPSFHGLLCASTSAQSGSRP